jgi:hypothetical protein
VVFIPQKSKTECVRVSKMSSWGFMSFVLSVVNGVINISNNINNNNNNRNNNNNDDNNNQFNTNLANGNNVQTAGGMAMSKRQLQQLRTLDAIRDKFRRKLEAKMMSRHNSTNPAATNVTRLVMPLAPQAPDPELERELAASRLLEQLYQSEVVQKQTDQDAIRQEVSDLMEKMYQEQKAKMAVKRKSREFDLFQAENIEANCVFASSIVYKCSMISLAYIELWVEIHDEDLNNDLIVFRLSNVMKKARSWGRMTSSVASAIQKHILFLLGEVELQFDNSQM